MTGPSGQFATYIDNMKGPSKRPERTDSPLGETFRGAYQKLLGFEPCELGFGQAFRSNQYCFVILGT